MEAVPRLPMISFELKTSPENVDFSSKLNQLIMTKFGEDPSSFSKEIRELETLRANSCIRVSETIEGVATLKKYYSQLNFLTSRFKLGTSGPFQFSWRDVYSGAGDTVSDISYELAAVLYNIGSLHTRLGVGEQRQDSDGMKMAVAHFQCAAWAFHSLPDMFPQDPEADLASDLMALKSEVCLAQAQECILEKSILDSRKPVIVTKVCGQVVEYYKQALRQLEGRKRDDQQDRLADIVGTKQAKVWTSFLQFKVAYYGAIGWLHQGMVSEESQRMGERVAYYQAASDCLVSAVKLTTKLDGAYKDVGDALQYCSDVINGKLENSKKENEFIYHEKIPELNSLPEVKGASLVKGIPFDPSDPEVSGPDLFARLVPLEAHEASSLYSEEQAKLLRSVCGEIETANDCLTVYLSSLQLEDIPSQDHELPQELVECAAGLSVRPEAVGQLLEAMAKLASVSADVEASLTELQALLKTEELNESEFQEKAGPRPKSIISELERETQKYHEAHAMASESNLTLHKAMQLHVKNLKLLGQPLSSLQDGLPSFQQLDSGTAACLADMRKIMDKVDEMRGQRASLESQFREAVQNDDITASLARRGEKNQDKVFEEEIKKHSKTVQYIRQNIQAQGNIIQALTERNAEYADARLQVDDLVRRRQDMIGSLVASYHAYEDLLTKTTKGLEFYDKLDANVSKLLARVSGVVKVQEEERSQQLLNFSRKAEEAQARSLQLVSGSAFLPAAPPPDSTPGPGSGTTTAPPAASGGGRPKLSDYLNAKKDPAGRRGSKTSLQPSKPVDEPTTEVPGVRPQPVGSESEPPHYQTQPSYPWPGYQAPGFPQNPFYYPQANQPHPQVSKGGVQQYPTFLSSEFLPKAGGYPSTPQSEIMGSADQQISKDLAEPKISHQTSVGTVTTGPQPLSSYTGSYSLAGQPRSGQQLPAGQSHSGDVYGQVSPHGHVPPVVSSQAGLQATMGYGSATTSSYVATSKSYPLGPAGQAVTSHGAGSQGLPPFSAENVYGSDQNRNVVSSCVHHQGGSPQIGTGGGYQPIRQQYPEPQPLIGQGQDGQQSVSTSGLVSQQYNTIPQNTSMGPSQGISSPTVSQSGMAVGGQTWPSTGHQTIPGQPASYGSVSQQPLNMKSVGQIHSGPVQPSTAGGNFPSPNAQGGAISQNNQHLAQYRMGPYPPNYNPQQNQLGQIKTPYAYGGSAVHNSSPGPQQSYGPNQGGLFQTGQQHLPSVGQGRQNFPISSVAVVQEPGAGLQPSGQITSGHQQVPNRDAATQRFTGQQVWSDQMPGVKMQVPSSGIPIPGGYSGVSSSGSVTQTQPTPGYPPRVQFSGYGTSHSQTAGLTSSSGPSQLPHAGQGAVLGHLPVASQPAGQSHLPPAVGQPSRTTYQEAGGHHAGMSHLSAAGQSYLPAGQNCFPVANQPAGQSPLSASGQPFGQSHRPSTGQPVGLSHPPSAGQPVGQSRLPSVGQPGGQSHPPSSGQPVGLSHPPSAGQPVGQSHLPSAGQPVGQSHLPSAGQPVGLSHPPGQPVGLSRLPSAGQPVGQSHLPSAGQPVGLSHPPSAGQPVGQSHLPSASQPVGQRYAGQPGGHSHLPSAGQPGGQSHLPSAGQPVGLSHPPSAGQPVGQRSAGQPVGQSHLPSVGQPVGQSDLPSAGQPVGQSSAGKPLGQLSVPASGQPVGQSNLPSAGQPVGQSSAGKPLGQLSVPASGQPVGQNQFPASSHTAGQGHIQTVGQSPGPSSLPGVQHAVPTPFPAASHPLGNPLPSTPHTTNPLGNPLPSTPHPLGNPLPSTPQTTNVIQDKTKTILPTRPQQAVHHVPQHDPVPSPHPTLTPTTTPQPALPAKAPPISPPEPSNLDLLSGLTSVAPTATLPVTRPLPVTTSPPTQPTVPMPGSIPPHQPHTTPMPGSMPPHQPHTTPSQPSEEERVARLTLEAERLQGLLTSLSSKTLGGQSPLETKWRKVLDTVESSDTKRSVSVARCYPDKNRVPDVLPFDQTRVELIGCKDDYINASRVASPGTGPSAIIAQAPHKKGSVSEFWQMVWQEGLETMVCLVPDQELGTLGRYLPQDLAQPIVLQDFTISLKSCRATSSFLTESVVTITSTGSTKQTRALVHLQMTGWPGPDLPSSPVCLLETALAVLALRKQQRVTSRPVLLHCLDGGSKSGTFLVVLWAVSEMDSVAGPQVPDLPGWPDLGGKVAHALLQRKGVVRDKLHLRLVHEALLYYLQDVLMKQGILNTGPKSAGGKVSKTHSRHPSQDFVLLAAAAKEGLAANNQDDEEHRLVEDNESSSDTSANLDSKPEEIKDLVPDLVPEETDSSVGNIPEDLSKLADISIAESPKARKITKEDFLRPASRNLVKEADPTDPLSQLDPLWSLK